MFVLLLFSSRFRYHRILKKEQQKSMEKVDLEKLAKENPDLYQSELDKADKLRALVNNIFNN